MRLIGTPLDDRLDEALETARLPGPLFFWGNLEVLAAPRIGIVGSRTAESASLQAISSCAHELAAPGATVVSGGAVGTDCAAHEGALAHPAGRTVFVLPCPIEAIDTRSWRPALANLIEANRCLFLSTYPAGTRPQLHHPLHRNRLLVALSQVLLVGETRLQSGTNSALNTALKLERPVWMLEPTDPENDILPYLPHLVKRGVRLISRDDLMSSGLPATLLEATAQAPALRSSEQPDLFGS